MFTDLVPVQLDLILNIMQWNVSNVLGARGKDLLELLRSFSRSFVGKKNLDQQYSSVKYHRTTANLSGHIFSTSWCLKCLISCIWADMCIVLYCVMCIVLCIVLCIVYCIVHCIVYGIMYGIVYSTVYGIVYCVLHCIWYCVLHCVWYCVCWYGVEKQGFSIFSYINFLSATTEEAFIANARPYKFVARLKRKPTRFQ